MLMNILFLTNVRNKVFKFIKFLSRDISISCTVAVEPIITPVTLDPINLTSGSLYLTFSRCTWLIRLILVLLHCLLSFHLDLMHTRKFINQTHKTPKQTHV